MRQLSCFQLSVASRSVSSLKLRTRSRLQIVFQIGVGPNAVKGKFHAYTVTPAKAGVQKSLKKLDSGFRPPLRAGSGDGIRNDSKSFKSDQ
jgi:hypothetical protein